MENDETTEQEFERKSKALELEMKRSPNMTWLTRGIYERIFDKVTRVSKTIFLVDDDYKRLTSVTNFYTYFSYFTEKGFLIKQTRKYREMRAEYRVTPLLIYFLETRSHIIDPNNQPEIDTRALVKTIKGDEKK